MEDFQLRPVGAIEKRQDAPLSFVRSDHGSISVSQDGRVHGRRFSLVLPIAGPACHARQTGDGHGAREDSVGIRDGMMRRSVRTRAEAGLVGLLAAIIAARAALELLSETGSAAVANIQWRRSELDEVGRGRSSSGGDNAGEIVAVTRSDARASLTYSREAVVDNDADLLAAAVGSVVWTVIRRTSS